MGKLLSLLFATVLLLLAGGAQADSIVVIVNKDNDNVVDGAFVARVYMGQLKGWPDGTPVFALEQPEESEAHAEFCQTYLGKSPANYRAIWSQNIFTGKGLPPKAASPDKSMKQLVSTNRNAIGYIRASQVDDTVKVLRR